MTIFERRALSPPGASAKRSLAALAGLTLTASVALLLHRAAPGAPAIMPVGLAALSGLAALALAFALDEAALPRLTKAVAAGAGLIVFAALVEPEARVRLASLASAAFGVGLAAVARRARRQSGRPYPCRWRRCSPPRSRFYALTRPISCSSRAT